MRVLYEADVEKNAPTPQPTDKKGKPRDATRRDKYVAMTENTQYFPNQEYIEPFRNELVDSLMKSGTVASKNQFINFAMLISANRVKGVTLDKAKIIREGFINGDLELTIGGNAELTDADTGEKFKGVKVTKYSICSRWIADPRAYTDVRGGRGLGLRDNFKLRTLVFLSNSNKVDAFGDASRNPIEKILKAKTNEEIVEALEEFQTKDGSDYRETQGTGRPTTKGKSKTKDKDIKNFIEAFGAVAEKQKNDAEKFLDAIVWDSTGYQSQNKLIADAVMVGSGQNPLFKTTNQSIKIPEDINVQQPGNPTDTQSKATDFFKRFFQVVNSEKLDREKITDMLDLIADENPVKLDQYINAVDRQISTGESGLKNIKKNKKKDLGTGEPATAQNEETGEGDFWTADKDYWGYQG